MPTDYAIRSDFLVHWTGKDLDEQFDASWYSHRKTAVLRDTEIANAYIVRLRNILRFGLWLTEESDLQFNAGDHKILIPSTPKVCFTELKLSESRNHAKHYGRLGIGVKWSTNSGHPVKGINYPNEVNNESRKTNPKAV